MVSVIPPPAPPAPKSLPAPHPVLGVATTRSGNPQNCQKYASPPSSPRIHHAKHTLLSKNIDADPPGSESSPDEIGGAAPTPVFLSLPLSQPKTGDASNPSTAPPPESSQELASLIRLIFIEPLSLSLSPSTPRFPLPTPSVYVTPSNKQPSAHNSHSNQR